MMGRPAFEHYRGQFLNLARAAADGGPVRPAYLARVDGVLDEYNRGLYYATEWDANEWGFLDNQLLCALVRDMNRRPGTSYPGEAKWRNK